MSQRDVARETAGRLAATLRETADALVVSAKLAEEHAARLSGRSEEIAAEERRTAARAREGADRARRQADEWFDFAAGHRRAPR